MAQTIRLKRSATSGAQPSTSQLELGEVAINTYDGKMFIKKNDGSDSIVEIGASADSSNENIKTFTATGALAQGDPVAIKSDGTVTKIGTATSISAATGSSVIFNAPNDSNGGLRDAGHMQVAYDGSQYGIVTGVDDGDGDKGCFRVFSVSGTTITLLGTTSTKINDLDVDYPHAIIYDSSLSKFVLYGRNKPSGQPGGAHIHMITLDSSGNATVDSGHYHANSINTSSHAPELLILGAGRLALVATNASTRLFIQILEYSNNTWVWGSTYTPVPDEGQQRTIRASVYDGKIVVIWRSGNPDKTLGVIADPGTSGSTVTLGTAVQLVAGDPNYRVLAGDVSSSGKYLFSAAPNQNNPGGYHNLYIGDINTTNKTFSTPTVTSNLTKYMYHDIVWEEALGKFVVTGQRQSGDDKVSRRIITIDSSDGGAYSSETLLDNVNVQEDAMLNTVTFGNGLSINAWYENQGSESLQSGILQLRQEAVTGSGAPVKDYIGVNKTGVSDGQIATIVVAGTATANATLSRGTDYYLTSAGVLTSNDTGHGPIGKAVTTSELLLKPLAVQENLSLASLETGSEAGPIVELYRNSASPADGDYLGQFKFQGENDAGAKVLYAKVTGKTSDVSDGSEDGLLETAVKKAGSNVIVSRQTGDALKLINGTGLEVDGNLLVGTTDSAPNNNSNQNSDANGIALKSNGVIQVAKYNEAPIVANRTGSDGNIIEMRKDGSSTLIGSIGTSGGEVFIGSGDTTLRFFAAGDAILPRGTGGAQRDAAISLGTSSNRFKDLHLSGTITADSQSVGTQSIVSTAPTSASGFPNGHVWYVV